MKLSKFRRGFDVEALADALDRYSWPGDDNSGQKEGFAWDESGFENVFIDSDNKIKYGYTVVLKTNEDETFLSTTIYYFNGSFENFEYTDKKSFEINHTNVKDIYEWGCQVINNRFGN